MTAKPARSTAHEVRRVAHEAEEHPVAFAGVGALLVLLGLVAIGAAFWATLATVLVFGVLLLIGGVIQLVDAGANRRAPGFGLKLASGLLAVIVGGLLAFDPVSGAVGLTLLLAVFFLFAGVLRLSMSGHLAGGAKGWLVAGGVIDLVLGALIVLGWPATGTWVIGLFLGIDLVFAGATMLAFAGGLARPGTA